jgi:hypothetical protein
MEPEVDLTFIKPGYVLLYRSEKLLSRLIRFFQKSPYHHAGLVIELWGEIFVAESDSHGLTVNRIKDSIKGYTNIVLQPKFEYDPIKINKFVVPILGKHKYDSMSLLFYQLVYLITGKWIGRKDEHASKRLYCSEFVAYVFYNLNNIFEDWYKTNPRMIFENPNFTHFKLVNK